MDAKTCILTRRSHRQYQPKPVSHDLIEEVISLAAYAPSWKNTQISRYIAIEDPAVKQEIVDRFCLPGTNNPSIIASCPVLIAQTFLTGRSGFNRDGTYNRTAGSTTTAASPPKLSAWPPTTWGWAPSSWGSLTGKGWRNISGCRRARSSWRSSPWAGPPTSPPPPGARRSPTC